MLMMILAILLTSTVLFLVVRRIAQTFNLSTASKYIAYLVLFAGVLIYAFPINEKVEFYGLAGWFFLQVLFVFMFLEIGLSIIYPSKRRLWTSLIIPTAVIITAYFVRKIDTVFSLSDTIGIIIGMFILFAISYLIYKSISRKYNFSEKQIGYLIVSMSTITLFDILIVQQPVWLIMVWMNYGVFTRIVGGLDLKKNGLILLGTLFLLGLFVSYPQSAFSEDIIESKILSILGGIWLGIIGMGWSLSLDEMLLSKIFPAYKKKIVSVMLILLVSVSGYSIVNGLSFPVQREVNIALPDLPENKSGYTIVQLTDLHLGKILDGNWLNKVVDTVNSINPDLVVITGDIFENGFDYEDEFRRIINGINTENNILAVTGNHEFYYGIDNFFRRIKDTKIELLMNRSVVVDSALQIAGINDSELSATEFNGPDLDKAFEQITDRLPVLLLSHRPDVFSEAVKMGVDLQLSGHTHAGQIPPLDLIAWIYFKYFFGLYEVGSSYIYTSCGTGYWGVPMRLFSRSEIVKIVLTTLNE